MPLSAPMHPLFSHVEWVGGEGEAWHCEFVQLGFGSTPKPLGFSFASTLAFQIGLM